ncbi:MAG: hypothetical protein PHQ19_02805 [Candidatus Krumholzibacteria bacterium]|nr:hypothetical protein [Candidatus Krumholzibacteria bacterium]
MRRIAAAAGLSAAALCAFTPAAPSAALPATGEVALPTAPPATGEVAPGGYVRAAPICDAVLVYHEPKGERLAVEIGRIACGSVSSIADGLGLQRIAPVTIVVARETGGFRRLHGGRLPVWGEAFADMERGLIGIDASRVIASPHPLRTVVLHELSHVLFEQRVGGARSPAWLVEGLAMRQSGEWTLEDEWNLARSVWSKELPFIGDLDRSFPRPTGKAEMAYRVSHAAVDFLLAGRPEAIVTLTAFLRDTGDFDRAFLLTFGETHGEFASRFQIRLEDRYGRAGAVLDASPYWLSLAGLFLLVYALKRYRTARKVAEWERGDDAPPHP